DPDPISDGMTDLLVGNIDAQTDWREALSGVDTVVHLAARVHVMDEQAADPLAAFRQQNVQATEQLARMAAAQSVRRFIFVSSIKVNGEETSATPFRETDEPNPQDAYAVSKWEAEQALWRVAEETGLEVVMIRPPLIYGPGVQGNFKRLLKLVAAGIPLPLAMVKNQRSLLGVENLADLLFVCSQHPAAANETFLATDGEDLSTPELLRQIAVVMGKQIRLIPLPLSVLKLGGSLLGKTAELDRLLGSLRIDSSHVRRQLGWQPPFTVAEGLQKTLNAYLQRPSR
ncbi:MAG TPA: NAD-dependent epimerase/dehydratase family protein, partial [Malonomonas sp.]